MPKHLLLLAIKKYGCPSISIRPSFFQTPNREIEKLVCASTYIWEPGQCSQVDWGLVKVVGEPKWEIPSIEWGLTIWILKNWRQHSMFNIIWSKFRFQYACSLFSQFSHFASPCCMLHSPKCIPPLSMPQLRSATQFREVSEIWKFPSSRKSNLRKSVQVLVQEG